jgi:glycosyltransferase involved in cell wall biosynthesis
VSDAAHHSSHRGLLKKPASIASAASVDAIIVPSARRAAALEEAGRLTEQLGCTLLVLCSKHAEARRAAAFLADRPRAEVIAIDFPEAGVAQLPTLETTTVLGVSRLRRNTDTSAKRNLGLVLARMAGWKRVVFLDDDITVPDPADLTLAAALLDTRDGVGLHIGGFPDNSVVCHANREAGAPQDTFIGGGALAVPTDRIDSFFPEIYNEDWFFLLGNNMLRPVGQVGLATQKPYDPFATPDRARGEEFGDVLAEGLFALFDDRGEIADADEVYWKTYLTVRWELIAEIRARIKRKSDGPIAGRNKQILDSLAAASGRLRFIQPSHCVDWIEAWKRDRERWCGFMSGTRPIRRTPPGQKAIEVAVGRFGLRAFTCSGQGRPLPMPVRAAPRREPVASG